MAGQIDCCFEDILPECKIPGDVMVIILCNLPVKSLLKFKAVSKPWCSLISSPAFVKSHLRRQSIITNNLLMSSESDECIYGLLTHNHDKNNTCDSDVLILESSPVSSTGEKPNFVIDSCNGLVTLCSMLPARHGGIILWNPATRKCRRIQLPDGDFGLSFCSLGLCYVETTSDFKIVGWADAHSRIRRPSLFVYSLSSDSWKKWDWDCDHAEKSPITFGPSTLMSGCMHWLSCTCRFTDVITAFDVTDGAMSFFGVPDDCSRRSKQLSITLAIRGCLSIVVFLHFDDMQSGIEVWVMEEYGVEGSWVKRFTIRESRQVMLPLTSWNEGEIVVGSKNEVSNILTFYDLFNNKKYFLEFKSFRVGQVFSYVESLQSVGTDREEIAPCQLVEG